MTNEIIRELINKVNLDYNILYLIWDNYGWRRTSIISGISVWYDLLGTERSWLEVFNGIVVEHSSVEFAQCQQECY